MSAWLTFMRDDRTGLLRWTTILLGTFCFLVWLTVFHLADTDLWAKLAIGAHFWEFGDVPQGDMFAFTPVLPRYIEHEWGAGAIFFGVLKFLGPMGLMWLKIALAFGALAAAMAVARRQAVDWNALLVLTVPAAFCLLPGYVPVVRSHAFSYCFFGLTLLGMEGIRRGGKWPCFALPPLFLVWSNIHGGFVAGLGAIAVYGVFALVKRESVKLTLLTGVACALATLVNIYGLSFWSYLIPALLHKRPFITEWQPLPLLGNDAFLGFRILFVAVIIVLLVAWRRTDKKSWPGLFLLALTAVLAWRSRRHAPFFAVTALAFTGPFLETLLRGLAARLPASLAARFKPALAVAVLYSLLAVYSAARLLPWTSFAVLAPVGDVPVREVDILSLAGAQGNLATPFGAGGYCFWRLHPRIKVSMDSRYETTFPESTFEMNQDFYNKTGTNWDRLIRDYPVDHIILEPGHWALQPADLTNRGYVLIWEDPGRSALLSLEKHASQLKQVAAGLPNTTIDPIDASIPDKWWK